MNAYLVYLWEYDKGYTIKADSYQVGPDGSATFYIGGQGIYSLSHQFKYTIQKQ